MDCFMGMKFDDAQIVKVMDTYEDLVAEFGGDDGLALSVACKEVEVENSWEKLMDEIYDKGFKSDLKIDIIMFDTDTLKPFYEWETLNEKQKDIEQIGGWAYSRINT